MGINKFLIILLFLPLGVMGQDYSRPIGYFQQLQKEKEQRIKKITLIGSFTALNVTSSYLMFKNYDEKFICFSFGFSIIATFCIVKNKINGI